MRVSASNLTQNLSKHGALYALSISSNMNVVDENLIGKAEGPRSKMASDKDPEQHFPKQSDELSIHCCVAILHSHFHFCDTE